MDSERRDNGNGRRARDHEGLLRRLFTTPQGLAFVATALLAGAGGVLYVFDARDMPERLGSAEAAITRLQTSDSLQSRKLDYLICSRSPRPENDVLALLNVRCWELPPQTLEPLSDDGT